MFILPSKIFVAVAIRQQHLPTASKPLATAAELQAGPAKAHTAVAHTAPFGDAARAVDFAPGHHKAPVAYGERERMAQATHAWPLTWGRRRTVEVEHPARRYYTCHCIRLAHDGHGAVTAPSGHAHTDHWDQQPRTPGTVEGGVPVAVAAAAAVACFAAAASRHLVCPAQIAPPHHRGSRPVPLTGMNQLSNRGHSADKLPQGATRGVRL
mmetsp:Transcript_67252/g.117069  ORF Transcript_67252/g.117069 Transcript_67252/m.117069 type:complete len:210 (+) Transcript_67252:95-724(+)